MDLVPWNQDAWSPPQRLIHFREWAPNVNGQTIDALGLDGTVEEPKMDNDGS
jgi:hypothetical protein